MPGYDHLYGSSQPPSTNTSVSTGTPNFGGAGTGGNNQNNNNNTNQNVDVDGKIDLIDVNTGYGADDAKMAAQKEREAEAKRRYINKLKNYALTGIGNDIDQFENYDFGYGGDERFELQKDIFEKPLFDPTNDPTLNQDLYNVNSFSGDIPITDFQKLDFLQNYGGIGGLFAQDSEGKAILDSSGNLITTGLGDVFLDGGFQAGFDPGNLDTQGDYTGSGITSFFNDLAKDYWKSRDEQWYGSDYWDDYLGEYYGPTERSSYDKNKRWQQKSLGEILQEGPVGFSDLQRIYGEELSETSGNPFAAVAQYNKQGAFSPSFGESIITEYS